MPSRLLPALVIVAIALGLAVAADAPNAAADPTPPSVHATVAPEPPDAASAHHAFLNAISCGAAGSCVAVGEYQDQNGHQQGLIDTWSGGSWTVIKSPLPTDAATSQFADVIRVACGAAGSCVALASYSSNSAPFTRWALLSLSGGTWAATPLLRAIAAEPFRAELPVAAVPADTCRRSQQHSIGH